MQEDLSARKNSTPANTLGTDTPCSSDFSAEVIKANVTSSNITLQKIIGDIKKALGDRSNFFEPREQEGQLHSASKNKIYILFDTNVGIEFPNLDSILSLQANQINRGSNSLIVLIELLTIIREELKLGGLNANVMNASLYRGENSLLKRSYYMPYSAGEELRKFYDIATDRFEKMVLNLFKLQDKLVKENKTNGDIANIYIKDNKWHLENGLHQAYQQMLTKLLEKRMQGNEFNFVADKVLCLTNFAMNFFSDSNKSVVLSLDQDYLALQHFVCSEIFPAYIAAKVKETVDNNKHAHYNWENNLQISIEHLEKWAKSYVNDLLKHESTHEESRRLANLIYNPQTGNVLCTFVHEDLRNLVLDPMGDKAFEAVYIAERAIMENQKNTNLFKILRNEYGKFQTWLAKLLYGEDS